MRTQSFLSTLFGFAFLAAVAYGLWLIARLGAGVFDGMDRTTAVITGTAALTVLLAAWAVSGGLHAIARRGEVTRQRAARSEAYEAFLRLHAGVAGDPFGPGRVVFENDAGADQRLLLHASPAVLGAYARLRRAQGGDDAAHDEMVELIRAMRRDLGSTGTDVPATELSDLLRAGNGQRVS